APFVVEGVGLGVGEVALDVPQPVAAPVAVEIVAAAVQGLALDRSGQGHGVFDPSQALAACWPAGAASSDRGDRRSLVIWLRCRSRIWKRKPWKLNTWPGSGIRRAS